MNSIRTLTTQLGQKKKKPNNSINEMVQKSLEIEAYYNAILRKKKKKQQSAGSLHVQ